MCRRRAPGMNGNSSSPNGLEPTASDVTVVTAGAQAAPERADTTPMDGLLAAAREVLGMEFAYLSEVRDDALVLREVDGDAAAYGGVSAGFSLPAEMSWCHQMVAGDAPQLVTDADALAQAAAHPFVRATGIRAYAGVPV